MKNSYYIEDKSLLRCATHGYGYEEEQGINIYDNKIGTSSQENKLTLRENLTLVVDSELKIEALSAIILMISIFIQVFTSYIQFSSQIVFFVGIVLLAFAGLNIINCLTRYKIGWEKGGPATYILLWIGFYMIVPNEYYYQITDPTWGFICIILGGFLLGEFGYMYASNLRRGMKKTGMIIMFSVGGALHFIIFVVALVTGCSTINRLQSSLSLVLFIVFAFFTTLVIMLIYTIHWVRKSDTYLVLYAACNPVMFVIAIIFGSPLALVEWGIQSCIKKTSKHTQPTTTGTANDIII